MDIGGKLRHQLIHSKCSDESPSYSPDGRTILFARANTYRSYSQGGMKWDDWDLWKMNVDGSQQHRLTKLNYYDMDPPYFSPDGKHIVFAATILQSNKHFVLMLDLGADSGAANPRKVEIDQRPSSDFIYDGQPCFSPDGQRIVFISTRQSRDSPFDYDVWTADLNGRDPKQVTQMQSINSYPVFSPDGQSIGFCSDPDRSDQSDLWTARVDGTALKRLTRDGRGVTRK